MALAVSSSTASATGIAVTTLTSIFAVAISPAASETTYFNTTGVSASTSGGAYVHTPLPAEVSTTDPPPLVTLTLVTFRKSPTSTSTILPLK